MNRNEYRRAFIMLRAAIQGYGGHVRLERRTLTGSMYFVVTAPQGVNELSAALVGRQNGDYFAAPIGPLNRDRRGQLTLAWQFDPRSIDGRPLEAYAWVTVAATGGPCVVALIGNVEGSRPMDPEALGRAVRALFASPALDAPAADLPERDETFPGDEPEAAQPAPEPTDRDATGDIKIYTRSRARLRSAIRSRAGVTAGARTDAESVPKMPVPFEAPVTAANQLGLDITSPWPGEAESLRRLFATQAPAQCPLADGYTYIRSPMPETSGYGDAMIGLRAENGRVTGVRHALPGPQAAEPPAGLDGYVWMPVGDGEGYWVMDEEM